MDKKKQNKIVEDLLVDLSSDSPKTLTSALKRVRSKGNESVIPSLFLIIEKNIDPKVTEEAKKIILELKSTAAIPFLIKELKSDNSQTRELVLNAFWQTGFNAYEYISEFVTAAVKGSYLEAFEASTIIENLEGPFQEEPIMEAQLTLKSYFLTSDEEDEKFPILKGIEEHLIAFELSI